MKGKHLAIGLLVALFGFVGLVFWLGLTGDRPEPVRGAPVVPSSVNGPGGGRSD